MSTFLKFSLLKSDELNTAISVRVEEVKR